MQQEVVLTTFLVFDKTIFIDLLLRLINLLSTPLLNLSFLVSFLPSPQLHSGQKCPKTSIYKYVCVLRNPQKFTFSTFFSTFLTWSSRNIHSLPATIHSMPATPLLWTSDGKFWQPLFSFTSERLKGSEIMVARRLKKGKFLEWGARGRFCPLWHVR